jgi:very-short-patch-repair endonuclease
MAERQRKRWRAVSDEVLQSARRLRRDMTSTERMLWQRLRGSSFRRQFPVGRFVLDFCSPQHKIAIEIDGAVHNTQQEYDAIRQAHIELEGWRFLRFTADEVFQNIDSVVHQIQASLHESEPKSPLPEDYLREW